MKKCVFIYIVIVCCLMSSCKVEDDVNGKQIYYYEMISQYAKQNNYLMYPNESVNEPHRKKYIVKFDDTTEMEIFIGISDNKLFYYVVLWGKDTSELDVKNIYCMLNIVNLISERTFTVDEIIDFMSNEKYNKSPGDGDLLVQVRTWGFWEDYSAEYRVHTDNFCTFDMAGRCKPIYMSE